MSFIAELKRRNVFKVGVAYAIVSWLIVQVISTIHNPLHLPDWFDTVVIVLLIIGFILAIILAWAYELTPEGLKPTKEVVSDQSITRQTGRKLNTLVMLLMGMALVFIVIDQYFLHDIPKAVSTAKTTEEPVAALPETSPETPAEPADNRLPNSIAVLPLENLSPDPNNAYFAAGIHDEILNSLTKLRNLNVIARTSVLQYANTEKTIPEIGRELNVETVMEGSIRYANNRVRVTTQLIDTMTGAHLWSEVYERDFDDIFAIQSDIAMNVANAMNATFSREEQQSLNTPATTSSAAYALYLQAMAEDFGGERFFEKLRQAIAIDPDFSAANGAIAYGLSQHLINSSAGSAEEWNTVVPKLRESADRAMAIDPYDIYANTALASLELFAWHWHEAEEAFNRYYKRAGTPLQLQPWFSSWQGKHDQAVRYAEEIIQHNPADWSSYWFLGWSCLYIRDYDAAVTAYRKAVTYSPSNPITHALLAQAETARRNVGPAVEELRLTEKLLGEDRTILYSLDMAYAYSLIGYREDSDRIIKEILEESRKKDIGTGGWAILYLAQGDEKAALNSLEAGVENARNKTLDPSLFSLMNLKLNYNNNPTLEKPEFVALRKQLTGF